MMQVSFVNTDQLPIHTNHVCYFTSSRGDEITLCEVLEEIYPHPDAPEDSVLKVTQIRSIRTYKRTEQRAANVILMEAAQNSCKSIPIQG